MYKNKQAQIIELLKKNKYMAVNEISEQLNISPSTIRRELTALEKKNLAIRTHGGVRLADSNNYTPDFALRIHQNVLEKR